MADVEVHRSLTAPGELTVILPMDPRLRRVVAELELPADARISALAQWAPADRSLKLRLVGPRGAVLSQAGGQSPVVFGTRADTAGGRHILIVEDARESTDTLVLTLQVNWSVSRPAALVSAAHSPIATAPSTAASSATASSTAEAASSAAPQGATSANHEIVYAAPISITGINWREGGSLRLSRLQSEGLRLVFTSAVNPDLVRNAVRLELGFPGSQEGLWRYEEVAVEVRQDGTTCVIRLPGKLTLTDETPARFSLDGDRLLSRTGTLVDADGTGLKLPSGDGRPGGVFRSLFRITP